MSGTANTNPFTPQPAQASTPPTTSRQMNEMILGEEYDYAKQIRTPGELGITSKGTLGALADDLAGLIGYVKLLVEGGGKASKINRPLGNKYFLETAATCKDKASGKNVTRSIYVNNVPDGTIPFISSGLDGATIKDFRGIVPGIMSNVAAINPFQILQAFTAGSAPECQAIELETINAQNQVGKKTAFVTTTDILNMSPCWFPDRINPITKQTCKQGFTGMSQTHNEAIAKLPETVTLPVGEIPRNLFVQLYYNTLGVLGLYILYRMFQRKISD